MLQCTGTIPVRHSSSIIEKKKIEDGQRSKQGRDKCASLIASPKRSNNDALSMFLHERRKGQEENSDHGDGVSFTTANSVCNRLIAFTVFYRRHSSRKTDTAAFSVETAGWTVPTVVGGTKALCVGRSKPWEPWSRNTFKNQSYLYRRI